MSSKAQETKFRILQSALDLLTEGGGKSTRMSDVAKAAGVSRQAVYLHFPKRADLLVAVTHYVDNLNDVDKRLVRSRTASTGRDRLTSFIDAWGDYIPLIFGVGKALMDMQNHDNDARVAWQDRMQAMRQGCLAAVTALEKDGDLTSELDVETATDLLWTLLTVENWEKLRHECGWSQEAYLKRMKSLAASALLKSD